MIGVRNSYRLLLLGLMAASVLGWACSPPVKESPRVVASEHTPAPEAGPIVTATDQPPAPTATFVSAATLTSTPTAAPSPSASATAVPVARFTAEPSETATAVVLAVADTTSPIQNVVPTAEPTAIPTSTATATPVPSPTPVIPEVVETSTPTPEPDKAAVYEVLNPDGPKNVDNDEFWQSLPRDGIRPIYEPQIIGPESASIKDDELVMGVAIGDQARAYPIKVLQFREMVNDEIDGLPILVSW